MIDPYELQRILIPRLEMLKLESNDKIKDFFIWPQYKVGGMELIYPNGRRYPKRLRQYKHEPENKAIHINGIEIGFVISAVPFLHVESWKGIGIKINPITRASNVIQNKARPKSGEEAKKGRPKKRSQADALKLGIGMDDYHKEDGAFVLEQHLHFLKDANKDNCPFDVNEIDKDFNQGKFYKVSIALKSNKEIQQKLPTVREITIEN